MLFKFRNLIMLSLLIVFMAACTKPSFIQNRNIEYLTATSIPPLRIPPGVSSEHFQNYYPIPDRSYPESSKNISLEPPGL